MNHWIMYFIITEAAAGAGALLDLLLADPFHFPHPVVIIGKEISSLERFFRKLFPKTSGGELAGGALTAGITVITTLLVTGFLCTAALRIHPVLGFALQTLWCWQALAIRGLQKEAVNVYHSLPPEGTLEQAQKAVGRIVGRDTFVLDETGVIKADCETVAENFSDGVIAPLFYMAIGGAPLALTYKAVNTLDSMIGYRNERYLYFGRVGARMDDVVNYIPSRIAALLWALGAAMTGNDGKNALRIWKRDSRKHASPNSAQTESACAGSLHVQLAGPAQYFGKIYDKPAIGDADRPIERGDILRCCRMLGAASSAGLVIFFTLRAVIFWILLR